MKNLLGLMIVALVVGYALTYKDETGESVLSKINSEDGLVGNVKKAEEATNTYGNASQKRIEAEFGEGY